MYNPDNIFINGTVLDRIISDLQPLINEYIRTFPLFVIRKHNTLYPNYRIININDVRSEKNMNLLNNYYQKLNGLPSIDSFYGSVLCGDKFEFYFRGCLVRCTDNSIYAPHDYQCINLANIISFRTSNYNDKDFCEQIKLHSNLTSRCDFYIMNKIGLYIRTDN